MLNVFGQTFKDNGYQLMNDRDSPIWQNPSYWPITFRITPNWNRESTNKVAVDQPNGSQIEEEVNPNGFDISGLDFHTGGTLYKNYSFYVLPSSDSSGNFHFETVMARLDNIGNSPWFNFKLGKFELDNIISEKRILTISNNGGYYQLYHFIPLGDSNIFGQMGDNQLGIELMGHSLMTERATRWHCSAPTTANGIALAECLQHVRCGESGIQCRISGGSGSGWSLRHDRQWADLQPHLERSTDHRRGNKPFNREGVFALLYVKKLDFSLFYQHGWDSAYFGTSTPSSAPLPPGAQAPSWNGGFVEAHYVFNPQLIVIQRDEFVRCRSRHWSPLREFGQYQCVHLRVPVLPLHVQPCRLCLSRRVRADTAAGGIADYQYAIEQQQRLSGIRLRLLRTHTMRTRTLKLRLISSAVTVVFFATAVHAQQTEYSENQRLNMESHVDGMTGHATTGQPIYKRFCVGCHGPLGDGQGENAQWIDPKPRNFTIAIFRCRSTPTGTLPTR